ncbi:MAG TPA: hypothetical protein OIL88_01795 [Coriobacteriaceae bacterium]|nr:hypothetical protein [Coriobacteriaceae bacterium]
MYISLQRCRKMSFLEGDVHVWDVGSGLNLMGVWAEEEGCPNLELCSKFIRSAYADRAALKTRHGRVLFTLRALAGSNPSSCALLKCAQKEKSPIAGAYTI